MLERETTHDGGLEQESVDAEQEAPQAEEEQRDDEHVLARVVAAERALALGAVGLAVVALEALPVQSKRISVNVWLRALESEPETKWSDLIGRDGGRLRFFWNGWTGLRAAKSLVRHFSL